MRGSPETDREITIESSFLKVYLRPEVGGKIAQIVDRRSGNEILVPPSKPYVTIPAGACWLDYDISGMDDCFPNIAPGTYPEKRWVGVQLPDHGEWVYGAWKAIATSKTAVVLERTGTAFPYYARKTIRLIREDTIQVVYEVKNNGDTPFIYLWAAHPLIRVDEFGYRLILPEGTSTFRALDAPREHEWPLFEGRDLSYDWIPSGHSLKLFILGLTEGWCELRLSHCTLRFEFDLADTPRLGIWLNNWGFPFPPQTSFRCVAIEPCSSASDTLGGGDTEAYPSIAAGGTTSWAIRLKVDTPQ